MVQFIARGDAIMNELQTVIFLLNGQVCGADTLQVKEIKKYEDVTKIPEAPKFIEGVINLRGQVVPVVNLNNRFDLGGTEITVKTKIIITSVEEKPVGFIVNDVLEITKFTNDEIESVPDVLYNNSNSYLKSIGKKDDMLVSIVDLGSILSSNELSKISEISEIDA